MSKNEQIVGVLLFAVLFVVIALILIFTLRKSSSDQPVQPEVFVTGYYDGETFFRDAGKNISIGATLPAGSGRVSFLAKYTNNGLVDWAARQDGTGNDVGNAVATDTQNNVYMTGYNWSSGISFYSKQESDGPIVTLPNTGGGYNSFLAKYNSSGTVEWAAIQSGGGDNNTNSVATDSQNNVYATGSNSASGISFYSQGKNDTPIVTIPPGTKYGSFLAKYSNSGSVEWAARQDGVKNDAGKCVATDSQTNVYMTGYNGSTGISFYSKQESDGPIVTLPPGINSPGINYGSFLAKYTNNGFVDWAARQDGIGNDVGNAVATDSQNNVYMTGYNWSSGISFYSQGKNDIPIVTLSTTGVGYNSFLAKYSNIGTVEWAARQDGSGNDVGNAVATDTQNNVYITGYNSSSGISFYSKQESDGPIVTLPIGQLNGSFLAKYTNNGLVEWAARQDGSGNDVGNAVATDTQNNVYITGSNSDSGISFYSAGDPNTPVFTLEQIGASDDSTFTSKYNSKGEFQWAAVIGPSVSGKFNSGHGIATT